MTIEQFRANLDAYIDSELLLKDRREMEAQAAADPECGKLLDEAMQTAVLCAELDEGLVVPEIARQAWRDAINKEEFVRRAPGKKNHKAPARHIFTRVLSAAAALIVAFIAIGTALNGLNLDMPNSRANGASPLPLPEIASKSTAMWSGDAGSYEDGVYMMAEESYDMYNGVAEPAESFTLSSDGAIADEKTVTASKSKSAGDVIVLRSASRRARTKDFDASMTLLDDLLAGYGAYFEEKNVSGQAEEHNRSLSASIRVPSDALDAFLDALDDIGVITLREDYAEDITDRYTDTNARLTVLRSQLDQLNAMNAQAQNVTELVEIHRRATELMSEIEACESVIRSWDSRRSYSDVSLTLTETAEIIETPDATLGERMKNAFHDSLDWLRGFGQDLAVLGAALLPRLIIIVPAAVIVIVLLKIVFGRKKNK